MKATPIFSIGLITSIILVSCTTGAAVNTAGPENTPVPINTPTPLNTTTADLTNVFLNTENLPTGFHRFTDAEIKSMIGTDIMTMTTSMIKSMVKPFAGVANIVKTDLYGKNTKTVQFLVCTFFYPLDSASIGLIDMGFSNPAIISQYLKGPQILLNFNGIGNSSIGLTDIVKGFNMNILVFRRNNSMIALVEVKQNSTSIFDLKAIGQKMDQHVLAEYK